MYLHLVLEELGHQVTNLGACVPAALLVEHCRTHRPDLVVVSSVNGHGMIDGMQLIPALRAHPELSGTRVVIGGKLGIGTSQDTRHLPGLLEAGFDAVFTEDDEPDGFRSYLRTLERGGRP
ncbi:cobalamin B12-binding domain-containing protein [Streptomyces sp. 7R007]